MDALLVNVYGKIAREARRCLYFKFVIFGKITVYRIPKKDVLFFVVAIEGEDFEWETPKYLRGTLRKEGHIKGPPWTHSLICTT